MYSSNFEGHDCIGGAKTGSGKTIAFAAPMLTQWWKIPLGYLVLILTPTRELALQQEQFAALGANMNSGCCCRGEDFVQQTLALQRKPHLSLPHPVDWLTIFEQWRRNH